MQKINTIRTNGKNTFKGQLTIGLDLGDRSSSCCVLNEAGEILLEQKLPTTPEAMKQTFERMPRSRMAMETGTHSPWVSRLLTALGHEVIVAHAQKVRLIVKSRRKDDRLDARTLARLARIDPELLSPVQHRSAQAQLHLTEIRARAGLVSARTALVNAARGLVKSYGERLRKCGTQQVSRETTSGLSTGLREALEPLLREVESLNERIQEYDRRIEKMAKETYPETTLLKQVKGVGDLIATAYVLTRIASGRVGTRDVLWGCSRGGGTRARASHRCTSARRETSIYGRCWCRGRTTFWDRLGKIVICGAGDRNSRREEGKTPRNGRWWR
jgi:transposase